MPRPVASESLIALMASAAAYEDKGQAWANATTQQIEAQQAAFQQRMLAAIDEIGAKNVDSAIISAVRSGGIFRDSSGFYLNLALDTLP